MDIKYLEEALIGNREKNPERTNATLERVYEVMENVIQDTEQIRSTKEAISVNNSSIRDPITGEQAHEIAELIDQMDISQSNKMEIITQLMESEIATAEAIDLHKKYKIPVSELEQDIIPVKGQGCWIKDTKGKWYLDMDSNYSATNLGMSNPELAKGLYNQARLLVSMKEDRVQIARTRFLKEISVMMPKGLDFFFWQNSGSEAVDKSLKIAKAYTQSKDVIAFKNGFHGRTHGAISVTWKQKYREPFFLHEEDWVHFAEYNDIESVRKIMDETGAKIVILEMVQGEEAGNRPADPEFIKELWDLVHERNGVIIDDEVQAGFGRTAVKEGDWFACMSYGVVPDIMAIGKSFGGGYPVTAVISNKKIAEAMVPGYDGSTFGGNPMAMTSALIATRQMRNQHITKNVIKRSKQVQDGLNELKNKHSVIDQIQGLGLMIGFSLKSSDQVQQLQKYLRDNQVKSSLSTDKFIRFLPPTIISKGDVQTFLNRLDKALSGIEEPLKKDEAEIAI
ncbi:MAG: aminotransferase class III-fold pyridoxal phosphate-dependent enzyme [Candidatus Thermoplasmatota archaeon]|nr:aminotransferase class III-fold pyridoxal phosphate-dependent enzyme [Candidatus Thermoplasmatota archaeon]